MSLQKKLIFFRRMIWMVRNWIYFLLRNFLVIVDNYQNVQENTVFDRVPECLF